MQLRGHKVCPRFTSLSLGSSSTHTLRPLCFSLLISLPCYPSSISLLLSFSGLLSDSHFSPHRARGSHPSGRLTTQCGFYRLPDLYTHSSTYHQETGDKDPARHKDAQGSFLFFSNMEAQSPHWVSKQTLPSSKVQPPFSVPSFFLAKQILYSTL